MNTCMFITYVRTYVHMYVYPLPILYVCYSYLHCICTYVHIRICTYVCTGV